MEQEEKVEVNGVELEEGTNLWRYAGLNTWQQKIGDHDPDDILREVAEQLVENYPDAVDVDEMPDDQNPVEIVHTNLKANPGIYDDTELIRYNAMEVERINTAHGSTEISIKDWKEEKTFSFRDPEYEDPPEDGYIVFEPLSALEKHLGVTILPVTDDR